MPRAKLTERQQREKALALALARARVEKNLTYDRDVSEALNLTPSQYSKRKQDLYHAFGFDLVADFVHCMGMTGRELCACCGVPYEQGTE